MSAEAAKGPSEIHLHFCQRCGISIPQIDIDTGRARPAPGGYVCVGCVYQHRDLDPAAPARPRPVVVARGGGGGARLLAGLALLYVVGATTFLLARELQRPPVPEPADLSAVATVDSVKDLAAKVDQLDERNRTTLEQLRGNDERQRDDLRDLSTRVLTLGTETTRLAQSVRSDVTDLQKLVLETMNRTGLLREDVGTVRGALERLAREMKQDGGTRPTQPDPGATTKKDTPEVPRKSADELEKERLVAEYIAALQDRKGGEKTNQTRYNAAVQLGDLRDPQAIPALVDALQNDSYDLVKRAAAWSLGAFGKDAVPAIPALIGEIGGKEEYVGYMCERALGEITKAVLGTPVSFNFDPTMNATQRRKVQRQWEEWWNKNQAAMEG